MPKDIEIKLELQSKQFTILDKFCLFHSEIMHYSQFLFYCLTLTNTGAPFGE